MVSTYTSTPFLKKIVFFVSHQTGFGGLPERGRERMEGAGKAAAKSLPKTRNLTNRFKTNNKRPERALRMGL